MSSKPVDPEVLILRSGYASRDLYLQAIAQAEKAGRVVRTIEAFQGDEEDETW